MIVMFNLDHDSLYRGVHGKILRVELTRGKICEDESKDDFVRKHIGGYGTAAKILYDEVPPWAGALDPMNELIFSTGPLCGTTAPTQHGTWIWYEIEGHSFDLSVAPRHFIRALLWESLRHRGRLRDRGIIL